MNLQTRLNKINNNLELKKSTVPLLTEVISTYEIAGKKYVHDRTTDTYSEWEQTQTRTDRQYIYLNKQTAPEDYEKLTSKIR